MTLNDTFTEADGTPLTLHTADSGGSWTTHPVSTGTAVIDGGRVHGDGFAIAYSSAAAADCEVSGVFRCLSADGHYVGLLVRMSTTVISWYGLLLQFSDGFVIFSAGTLGSSPLTFNPGEDYHIKFSAQGALLRGFLDGYEAIYTTNDSIPGPGRIGVAFESASDASHGLHLDSISASDDFETSQLLFVGDSLTSGGGSPPLAFSDRYPTQLVADIGWTGDWANRSVSGRTLATMLDAADEIDACRRVNAPKDVVILWGGLNDLADGATSAEVIDDLIAYGDARREAGFRVVVLTLVAADPASPTIPDDFEALRTPVNAWLRAHWSEHFDALADVAADDRLSDATDATYFKSDGVHLEALGASAVAEIVAAALGTLDAPAIHVSGPRDQAVLLSGDAASIQWTSNAVDGNVTVLLSIDGGENFDFTLASNVANSGALTWTPAIDQLSDAARVRVMSAEGDVLGDSGAFKIATTSAASVGSGVSLEQLIAALGTLREHGDAAWGRNPILPVVARVNAEPVSRTSLTAYQRGRSTHRLSIVDATGTAVDLSGKSLQFSLETLTGAGVASTSDVSLFGEEQNIATLTALESWHPTAGLFRYALRDVADGARVWARGDYVVEGAAGPTL